MKTRITLIAAWPVFVELGKSIEHALIERFNFDPEDIRVHGLDEQNHKKLDRFNKEDVELTFILKALRKYIPRFRGRSVLFQTEELWNRRESNSYFGLYAPMYDRCLEMYDENVNLRNTANVVYCPVGYSPAWEFPDLEPVEEDIDVLFHGSITKRRDEFQKRLKLEGFNVHFTNNVYVRERANLIMRSKIVINIKAHPMWSYGPMHCLPTQSQKKFMLTERANGGYGPFKPGVHVQEYNGEDDCVEKVRYWIEHEKERKDFTVAAYEDMVKTCHFNDIFEKAMGPCREKKLGAFISKQ
jgi:hypothetical protein